MRRRECRMQKGILAALTAVGLALGGYAAAAAPQLKGRFQDAQTLALEFPEPMRTWDNDVRDDLVRITPALPARCAWDNDLRLACHLQQLATGATRYRIELAPGLKTQAGATLDRRTLTLETERPRLQARIERWVNGLPSITLYGNMPMDAQAVHAAVRLRVDGKPAPLPALHALAPGWRGDKSVRFELRLPALLGEGRLVSVHVQPGLQARPGPLRGLQDERLLSTRVRETFALRGVSCAGRLERVVALAKANTVDATCVPGEPVLLLFTRDIDTPSRGTIARHVAGDMKVSLGWAGEGFSTPDATVAPVSPIRLDSPAPNSELVLNLDAAIRAEDGTALPRTTVRIRTGDAQPQLHAVRGNALVAEGGHPPAMLEVLNATSVMVDVTGLGRRSRSETVTATAKTHGTSTPVASATARQTLAEGGWVRWSPDQGGEGRSPGRGTVEFASPAFDLQAVAGRREVLAWANEWDRDAPVSGAEIELLWRDRDDSEPRVAARGRTGVDGTVVLRLGDEVVIDPPEEGQYNDRHGPSWWLRAVDTNGLRRAVLPAGETARHYGQSTGLALPRRVWGVSDRPLYHAGDTVHYRLWQRELEGVQLHVPRRQTPVTLRLFDTEREKAVLEWQATPDAEGDIAGELTLPIHLTDATYCIGVDNGRGDTHGSCFFVGTYRAQDLWVEAKSRGGVLRDGERYRADVKAGYFSGGPAGGAKVGHAELTLVPLPVAEAYPRYAGYQFIDVEDDDTQWSELDLDSGGELDAGGALRVDVPVKFDGPANGRPAFGTLALDVEVSPDDREGTVAGDVDTRYARYDQYVGLKTSPEWFGRDDKVAVEGVVITAQGQSVPAEVEVTIEYMPGFGSTGGGEQLTRCTIRTGTPAPCDFPRTRSGRYRLTARSGDAAPAQVTQYVWAGDQGIHGDVEEPEMTVLDPSLQRNTPVRVLIKQPFARARALLVIASGGSILGHRVEKLVGNAGSVALPVAREWDGVLSLQAYVREGVAAKTKDGYREPVRMESLEASVPAATASPATPPLSVSFEPGSTRPGSHARLVLRNDSPRTRGVTVAVMDDALRAQAQRWLPYADPMGATGFAEWRSRGEGSLSMESFSRWTGGPWRWLLPWSRAVGHDAVLPPPPEQPPMFAEDPSPVDMPAAAPQASANSQATVLDRIEVTGSRIKRADVVESREAKAPDKTLPLRADAGTTSHPSPPGLLLRTRFADTALWLPDVRLAPGESRSFDVALPDNLTRWRAVVWSSAAEGDFAMDEATVEAGLPVEARLQTPVRLYPGDESRIAANVRHVATSTTTAHVDLQVQDAGGTTHDPHSLQLQGQGQGSVATVLHPRAPGAVQVVARAETSAGRDAVSADIEVASPLIAARKLQAGWIGDRPLNLDLPALPAGAQHPQLQVELQRGGAAFTAQWTDDLHRYPHRCWEQILSRAVAAALALERKDESWPDAATVVEEALDNAAVFQTSDGGFVYFPGEGGRWYSRPASIPLTAYSLQALTLLQTLGHRVQPKVMSDARSFLAKVDRGSMPVGSDTKDKDVPADRLALFAFAAASTSPENAGDLDALWHYWDRLPLPAQVAATEAFVRTRHAASKPAVERLLQQAPLRGASRTLRLSQRYDGWMSSDLREQCALIGLLREHPQLAAETVQRELLAGMTDLYAGGVTSVDTQTGAYCLMALRDPSGATKGSVQVRFALGAQERQLQLAPGEDAVSWDAGAPVAPVLQVDANAAMKVPLSFVAQLDYVEDARVAQASAVGFRLERRYEVLRGGDWKPVGAEALRESDWIRVTLTLDTTAARDFVAITDSVPGGLRPTDLELSGVATADLKRVGDEGAPAFETRRLDARSPRFYAESLRAGRHEVHYFARVGNSGDYLAAPAVAELMYGKATYARTAATRLHIGEGPSTRK